MAELIETVAASPNPAAILRGTARGLEIVVDASAPLSEIDATVTARLNEAPTFFRGCNAVIRVDDGPLPFGTLGRLDEIAHRFDIRIAEVTPLKPKRLGVAAPHAGLALAPSAWPRDPANEDGVPHPNLALGSAPAPLGPLVATSEEAAMFSADAFDEPTRPANRSFDLIAAAGLAAAPQVPVTDAPAVLADMPPVMLAAEDLVELEQLDHEKTKVVVGPVRSGVILEHRGHLVIFGDVNPGAEVRAEGNIIVLGRLRGTAHAGIGSDTGFILGLRLEPQQLRIGRKVARGSAGETATDAEIAFLTGEQIVVERYQGRLPRSLAATISSV